MDTIRLADEGWSICRYESSMREDWNEFVAKARNATFLFDRNFMDYHSERFSDHSLMVRKGGKLVSILPANITDDEDGKILHSHQGLTYGGWLTGPDFRRPDYMLTIFGLLEEYCHRNGIEGVDYKPLPWIYADVPSDDDRYALYRVGATLTECSISETIRLDTNPGFDTQQKRNLKRALKTGSFVEELGSQDDYLEFHRMLSCCLDARHDATPVHTAAELLMLHGRFSEKIRIFGVRYEGKLAAGVCMFDCGSVAHSQYICSTAEGRENGLLTLLFNHLIGEEYAGHRYFDFGISCEDHGRYLNEGLARQKCGLGGSGVAYERWLWKINNK